MRLISLALFISSLIRASAAVRAAATSRKVAFSSFVSAAAILLHSTSTLAIGDDEFFGDTSSSVGSINLNIFAPADDASVKQVRTHAAEKTVEELIEPKNELDRLLNNIPSWKYYKIISSEYSRRNSDFNGDVNFLAPLL